MSAAGKKRPPKPTPDAPDTPDTPDTPGTAPTVSPDPNEPPEREAEGPIDRDWVRPGNDVEQAPAGPDPAPDSPPRD